VVCAVFWRRGGERREPICDEGFDFFVVSEMI
jgi:hypothetical protein